MDVTNFFQLQRTFECHGEVHTSPQIECIFVVLKFDRYFFDFCILFEQLFNLFRNGIQLNEEATEALA